MSLIAWTLGSTSNDVNARWPAVTRGVGQVIRNRTIEPISSEVTVTVYRPRSSSTLPPHPAGTVRSARALSRITIVRPLGTLNVFVTEVPSGKQQMRIVNEVPAGPAIGSTVDPATKGTSGTPPVGMNANSTYWKSSGCPTSRVTNAASWPTGTLAA